MAIDNEIWFGFPTYDDYRKYAPPDAPVATYAPPADAPDDEPVMVRDKWEADVHAYAKTQDHALFSAWKKCASAMGWTGIRLKDGKPLRTVTAKTEVGHRDFYPFQFGAYESDEVGLLFPDAVIGVALSGRYQPTFLDFEDPNGGLPNPLLADDSLFTGMIAVAVMNIIRELPWFANATIMTVLTHY